MKQLTPETAKPGVRVVLRTSIIDYGGVIIRASQWSGNVVVRWDCPDEETHIPISRIELGESNVDK